MVTPFPAEIGLDTVAARIEAGEAISDDDLVRVLAAGPLRQRQEANFRLFRAFAAAGRGRQALWCAQRAWLLGLRHPSVLQVLANDAADRRSLPDAVGLLREGIVAAAEAGDPATACHLLIHFHSTLSGLGLPLHDPIVTPAMIRLLRRPPPAQRPLPAERPLRIGYLFWGETFQNNVLPPILIETARHHDRERFQPFFFSTCPLEQLRQLNTLGPLQAAIAEIGATLEGNDAVADVHDSALRMVRRIREREIDVLVVAGQYGLNFLIAAMRPAPLVVGLDSGHPHTYSSPALDHIIVPSGPRHVMEAYCDASAVLGSYTKFTEVPPRPVDRAALQAAPDDVVIMTSGADNKFRSPAYLQMLGEVVAEQPQVRLIVIGPDWSGEVGRAFRQLVPPQALARVALTGYRTDFAALVRAADIYVDTYPVGGGYSMYEVLSAGIPAVTFGDKLEGLFNKALHYAPAAQYLGGTDIVVAGDEVGHMKRRLLELVSSPELRRRIGAQGPKAIAPLLDKTNLTREVEQVIGALRQDGQRFPDGLIHEGGQPCIQW